MYNGLQSCARENRPSTERAMTQEYLSVTEFLDASDFIYSIPPLLDSYSSFQVLLYIIKLRPSFATLKCLLVSFPHFLSKMK
jgi:hypothetical protein